MELVIVICRCDKKNATRGDDRATIIFAARVTDAFGGKLRKFSEWDRPDKIAGVQINGVQRAPGWLDRRVPVRVEELIISVAPVFEIGFAGQSRSLYAPVGSRGQVIGQRRYSIVVQSCERRHTASTFSDDARDLRGLQSLANINQRRKLRRATFAIGAMATRTICKVSRSGGLGAVCAPTIDESQDPWHFVGIHIEVARIRIERTAAPFAAAIKAWKDDSPL